MISRTWVFDRLASQFIDKTQGVTSVAAEEAGRIGQLICDRFVDSVNTAFDLSSLARNARLPIVESGDRAGWPRG